MTPISSVPVFAALFMIVAAAATPCEVYTGCSFKFCNDKTEFRIGDSDTPYTGPICIKDNAIIGDVKTGQAALVDPNGREFGRTLITNWSPAGLSQSFPKSFFKTYRLLGDDAGTPSGVASGVGNQYPQGNQADYLDKTCWALNIVEYEVLNADGSIKRRVKDARLPQKNCVAWRLVK